MLDTEREMKDKDDCITAECALFACRVCHTKTGHLHQKWCTLSAENKVECENCLYYSTKKKKCAHPYRKKGGDTV